MQVLKNGLSILLMTAILFGGGYWYYTAIAGCNVPISYQIGAVDTRFNITNDEIRNAISSAESIWEDGTDRNLFTYSPNGRLVINFVYDERQALNDAQKEFEVVLEKKEDVSESVKTEYEKLVSQYETLRASYEKHVSTYETKLNTYNAEVADWNARGGAPKDVFERLQSTKASLAKEENRLDDLSDQLNALVRKINNLSSKGNTLVSDYNSLVNEYNDKFADSTEFTQGDYQNEVINIYEFGDDEELTIVLAHELGHALSINHVAGADSIMYHQMGEQILTQGLTIPDRTAFTGSCGNKGTMADTLQYLRETLEGLLRKLQGSS
jgi:vacuolar-type H+-ATPase subunit D/Vma8